MDAHLIYSSSSHMKSVVTWSEWVYCGIGDDIKEDVIEKTVNEYFQGSLLYFVTNRKESEEMNKMKIFEMIKTRLGQIEISIWDSNFKKVIEFNKIGVMRSGFIPISV